MKIPSLSPSLYNLETRYTPTYVSPSADFHHLTLSIMSITTVTNGSQSSSEVIADTSVAWYKPDIGTIPVAAATLLEEYSNIPPENLIAHVSEVVS